MHELFTAAGLGVGRAIILAAMLKIWTDCQQACLLRLQWMDV